MKTRKTLLTIAGILLLLVVAVSVSTVVTAIATAESAVALRTLPAEPVSAGEFFTVSIDAQGYGTFGQVIETLPEGSCYLTSTLDPSSVSVTVSANTIMKFLLVDETTFTYTVRAPDEVGTYTFCGIFKDMDNNEYVISGDVEISIKTGQFDTGSPANPYPSIFGMHTGNITPSQTITVQKLYTYPCPGTGGHAEAIELYENGTLIANGTWNGYKGDWHKISLNSVAGTPYVTLLKNQVYCYTIHTGSYPGIIHETSFNATGGTITCTDFTDANGKRYEDWIPAIRLE